MARKLFVLAVLIAAGSVGAFGFQLISYLEKGAWPSVPVGYVWEHLVGSPSIVQRLPLQPAWHWLGGVPVTILGLSASYLVFLASDILRRR